RAGVVAAGGDCARRLAQRDPLRRLRRVDRVAAEGQVAVRSPAAHLAARVDHARKIVADRHRAERGRERERVGDLDRTTGLVANGDAELALVVTTPTVEALALTGDRARVRGADRH